MSYLYPHTPSDDDIDREFAAFYASIEQARQTLEPVPEVYRVFNKSCDNCKHQKWFRGHIACERPGGFQSTNDAAGLTRLCDLWSSNEQ